MLILSSVIFGTIGIFRKYIPMSSALLAFFRGVIGSAFLLLLLAVRKLPFRHGLSRATVVRLVITGAVIGLNWVLLFEAYNNTSVAVATLCYYMEPAIVILLSPMLFGERLTPGRLLCVAGSVAGMVLVSGVTDSAPPAAAEVKGILFGLGAACLYSVAVIMNKKLPGIDVYEKTATELLSAAAVMIPYILLFDRTAVKDFVSSLSASADAAASAASSAGPSALTVVLLILTVGLVHTGAAYAMYLGSMDGLRAQTIALLGYIDPVTALILSFLVLREPLTVAGALGAVLIIASAVLSESRLVNRPPKN